MGSSVRRLRPYEAVLLADLALVVLLVRYGARIRLDVMATLLDTRELAGAVLVAFGLGVAAHLLWSLIKRGRRGAHAFRRAMPIPATLVDLARLFVVTVLASYVYTWLKVTVPLLHARLFDESLLKLETVLHFGLNPSRLLIGLFPFPGVWRFVDAYYNEYMTTILVGLGWFATSLSWRDRARFAAGFTLLWILGSWWYLATPALGPCYLFPSDYSEVWKSAPLQAHNQAALLLNYRAMRSFPLHPDATVISPFLGIAAMPSLHVAGQAFLALFARRRSRVLFLFFLACTVLTFYGSLVTGWHYAVDGYAGVVLAWVAYRLGDKLSGAAPRPITTSGRE